MFHQLTLKDRAKIQFLIEYKQAKSLKEIADEIHHSSSTVYRELINKRLQRSRNFNRDHGILDCPITNKFPFVCNACNRKNYCSKTRYFYDAYSSDVIAKKNLILSRKKPYLSKKQIQFIDSKVSPRVLKKQSLYHILSTDTSIGVSQSTLRRYINAGYFQCRTIDLPRTVEQRVRKPRQERKRIPIEVLIKRTYLDYIVYRDKKRRVVLQLDTLIGLRNDKSFVLTLFEPTTRFQWGYLLSRNASSINTCMKHLIDKLFAHHEKLFFDCILTDNGYEFNRLAELEVDIETGEKRFKLFFCDPYSSYQKGGCERNHEFFRYIHKKGKTLDFLSQDDIKQAFSHMNSLKRDSLSGKSPYEAFKKKFKLDPDILGISEISPEDVKLKK